jgi:hypothetical protein
MSQWTHVCGCIRIDSYGMSEPDITKELLKKFGLTCEFNDDSKVWDACTVPCGSEGSVQYAIIRTGSDSSVSWGLVYIWGDLRDYEDHEAIYQWIKTACENEDYYIRDCAVIVRVEYQGEYLIRQCGDDIVKEEITKE